MCCRKPKSNGDLANCHAVGAWHLWGQEATGMNEEMEPKKNPLKSTYHDTGTYRKLHSLFALWNQKKNQTFRTPNGSDESVDYADPPACETIWPRDECRCDPLCCMRAIFHVYAEAIITKITPIPTIVYHNGDCSNRNLHFHYLSHSFMPSWLHYKNSSNTLLGCNAPKISTRELLVPTNIASRALR